MTTVLGVVASATPLILGVRLPVLLSPSTPVSLLLSSAPLMFAVSGAVVSMVNWVAFF
jgi:hypothetical protein